MDGDAKNTEAQGRSHWVIIAALIISDTIGSGVLALPATLANLGWIAGIIGILTLGYVSLYTGQLIGRLHSIYPETVSYADLGEEFLGKAGRAATGTIAYVQMFGTCVVFLVGMNTFVDQVAEYMGIPPVCFPLSVGIISAVALIFAQVRDLHGIGQLSCWIALPTLYLCLALLFYQLLFSGEESIYVNRTHVLPPFGLDKAAVNFMNVVQTYAGHCMFFELLGSMSQPKDFNKALWSSQAVIVVTYLGFSALVYSAIGYDVANPFQLSLHPSIAVCIADISMILHVLISLLIYHHIVSKGLLDGLHSSLLKKGEGEFVEAPFGRLLTGSFGWAVATALVLACAWFVANLVPFFSDVMALLSSVGAVNLTYGFPAVSALLQHRRCRKQSSQKEPVELENGQLDLKVAVEVPSAEVFLCPTIEVPFCWSIAIFSAFMMVFGASSAVRDTLDTWASISRHPFGC